MARWLRGERMNDSGHYYRRDGTPCYEVPNKTGGMRGINLAWDKGLELVPSVTTILNIMTKPQLNIWRENQMMLEALTVPRIEGESDDAFCARIREGAFQQVDDAADMGTRVHDAIEAYYNWGSGDEELIPYVLGAVTEVKRLFPGVNDWIAERSFACSLGYGGKVDLHSPSTGIVVDFKGKDGDFSDGKKLAFDQYLQLAAYQFGLGFPFERCANVFFSRTHPGVAKGHVWSVDKITEGWGIFYAALELWKKAKKYDSSF
jgi:hypothetical protein